MNSGSNVGPQIKHGGNKRTVKFSDIKVPTDAFISERKVARITAELNGETGTIETPGERSTNIIFLADLLVTFTALGRGALERGSSDQAATGIIAISHYIAGNLQYRISASTNKVWSVGDCLGDYAEAAEHYGIGKLLQTALSVVEAKRLALREHEGNSR